MLTMKFVLSLLETNPQPWPHATKRRFVLSGSQASGSLVTSFAVKENKHVKWFALERKKMVKLQYLMTPIVRTRSQLKNSSA